MKIRTEEPSIILDFFAAIAIPGQYSFSQSAVFAVLYPGLMSIFSPLKKEGSSARIHASGYRPCLQAGVGQKYNICSLIWKAGDIY